MANMALGAYTFAQNPTTLPMIKADRVTANVITYDSVAFFSWGASIVGNKILLEWDYMPTAQFTQLDTFYQADAALVWNPQDGSSKTYNVEITGLDGKYHLAMETSDEWRKDVKLELLILSEVA